MALTVLDGAGAPKTLKASADGADLVPHQNVDGLPAAFTADTTATKVAVEALAALISAGRSAVELNSTLAGYLANLVTLGGTVTASRVAVDLTSAVSGYLATLAGTVTSARVAVNVDSVATGKLDTLHADINPSSSDCDQVSSTNASAQLPSHACGIGAFVKNISTGSQKSYIKPGATASAGNGWELAVGEEKFFPCRNTDELRHYSTASGAQLCFHWV